MNVLISCFLFFLFVFKNMFADYEAQSSNFFGQFLILPLKLAGMSGWYVPRTKSNEMLAPCPIAAVIRY